MWPDHLDINVSRESVDRLEIYHTQLLKWQRAINIVSPKTIDDAWVRHLADSAQIEQFVPRETSGEKIVLADLGCGGGFPGLVLAMMRPDIEYHLIESDERKCQFMRTVSRETKLPESNVDITVHNQRIEDAIEGISPNIVTARALADLKSLLDYVVPWFLVEPDLECIFLKGANAGAEIEKARQLYSFDCEQHPSLTNADARILHLKNIRPKTA